MTTDAHAQDLDKYYSNKELGCILSDSSTIFRLFAPRAQAVTLVIFNAPEEHSGREIAMKRASDGVWEYAEKGRLLGKYYAYRVSGPQKRTRYFNPDTLIADPYSKALATYNSYRHPARTLIIDTQYNWLDDTYKSPKNLSDLIIYECHVRDLTAHPTSGIERSGTYRGFVELGKPGGLSYLKELGINAVELLPVQEFGNIEPPFYDSTTIEDLGLVNTWNPYARNHWGYMTSCFFAPESYYASDGNIEGKKWSGKSGNAVKELKDAVKALHKEGMAVILDVVYNHVSEYDYNPFKYIDREYYFRLDSAGGFLSTSGCGNDFKTERPMARRMIVESIKYWLREYNVDGFRFDLATMIDWETCKEITKEARKIKPNCILIAEPWGGNKYDLAGFSDIGWAAWNDLIRNGVKGQNPNDGLGFIFGRRQGNNSKQTFQNFLRGSLRSNGGPFGSQQHSVNYLESHDDPTMGDFIRVALHHVRHDETIQDLNEHAKLNEDQLALHRLAALFLFSSQGAVMLHQGQEFGKSKVVAHSFAPDQQKGKLDHNSYNKDNETNYLNYVHADMNRELVDYYRGLIQLRKKYPHFFGSATQDKISFLPTNSDFVIAMQIDAEKERKERCLVILNGNPNDNIRFPLPEGGWKVMVDSQKVLQEGTMPSVMGDVEIPHSSGVILFAE